MEDQEKLWDKIAPEWHEYKKIPAQNTKAFLEAVSGNILDLGSGSGRNLIPVKGKMHLVDFSPEMIKLAEEKGKALGLDYDYKVANTWEIPYPDEYFDYAICISALHCVEGEENREKTVQDLFRVLKTGGQAYFGVWNEYSKRFNRKNGKEKLVGWGDKGKRYYYLYSEDEVHELFRRNGFKIISSHNSEMMINFVAEKVAQ